MRNKTRSLDEWYQIVTECRQSGLSDAAWCEQNGISAKSFYNAVTRLRKKACEIPDRAQKREVLDLTSSKQDVVKVDIDRIETAMPTMSSIETSTMYLDNSHTVEIEMNGLIIKLTNSASPILLEHLISSLGRMSC